MSFRRIPASALSFSSTILRAVGLLLLLLLCLPALAQPTITPDDAGFLVDDGKGLSFTIRYPLFLAENGKQVGRILEVLADQNLSVVTYDTGAEVEFTVHESEISFRFTKVPAEVKYYEFTTYINYKYSSGGTWQVDEEPPVELPYEAPLEARLYQGQAETVTIRDAAGTGVALALPPFSHNQLTDNREWGWKVFVWRFHPIFNPEDPEGKIVITPVSGP